MNMLRNFFLFTIFLISLNGYSEDVISVNPIPGDNNGKKYIEIVLVNSSFDVANLQFDLKLPEGMNLQGSPRFTNRIPYTDDGWGDKTYDFQVQSNLQESGYTRFLLVPGGEMRPIQKGSGPIMMIIFTTDPGMESNVYPISLKNVELDKSVTESIKIDEVASYISIGNTNPLSTDTHVDLSGMTGYIPSFVVNQLNTDIASNESLKSLNLSGTSFENLGAELDVPNNKDLLWYTSDKASLNRTFTAGKWSTVCLPFTLETITVNTLLNNGCAVKGMTSYDSSEKTVTFDDVNTMSTGVPYLFKCSELKTKPFENIDITNPEAISTGPHNVTDNNLTFKGTYELVEPSSTGLITIYGYKDNQFVKVESGQSGKVQPFRAYMELAGGVGTRGFISIDGLDDATGINEIVVPDAEKTTPIYDLQGRKVDGNYHSRGILIQNGKKIIKK